MNVGFLRNDQHLLQTQLPGQGKRGVYRYSLIRFRETCSRKEQSRADGNALAMLEHLQIGHVTRDAAYRHFPVEGAERRIGFVAEPTKTE